MTEHAATVFVVDDDPALRRSMRWLIESVGLRVQTFASAKMFLEMYDASVPGCVVLDVRMPGMSGLELQEQLRERQIDIPVIIVTGYGDVPMAVRAMKGGAVDFIEKPASDQVLLDHIHQAISRDAQNFRARIAAREIKKRSQTLTNRERQVMEMVVAGLSSKEIAAQLAISFKTVEAHRANIMKKMEATSVAHLIRMNLDPEKSVPPPE